MKRITTPLFAALFVLVALTAALPALNTEARTDEQIYICDPIAYPDGSEGVAIVRVEISAMSTVMVTVEYYSQGKAEYLGRYEDLGSSGHYPTNGYEAEEYALARYHDRW